MSTMSDQILFEEKQYLGTNKMHLLIRLVIATGCFSLYHFSAADDETKELFFILGTTALVISALLLLVLHISTVVSPGSIVLDGFWMARRVKIDLSSIVSAQVTIYPRFMMHRAVYNLHMKGTIKFFTKGSQAVLLTDRDGLKYCIGSQKAKELCAAIEKQIQTAKV